MEKKVSRSSIFCCNCCSLWYQIVAFNISGGVKLIVDHFSVGLVQIASYRELSVSLTLQLLNHYLTIFSQAISREMII